jgi:arsenate reductase-like glutaredoxin family protein
MNNEIKLYGSEKCHKTNDYISVFKKNNLAFIFLDVIANECHAEELKSLYTTRKLNFPTIMIGDKRLRNPSEFELKKWLIGKGLI